MLYAIIDIGSTTVRMAIYRIEGGNMEMLMKQKHMLGLASYIQEDGTMSHHGIDMATGVLLEFKKFLAVFDITNVWAITTAAIRNAQNSQAIIAELESRTGIKVNIVSGEREAEYDFIAATHDSDERNGLLIDVGGASTELVYYQNKRIKQKISLPMGSLSLKTNYVEHIMPTLEEGRIIRHKAEAAIQEIANDFREAEKLHIRGIGGTVKGTCAMYNLLYGYPESNRIIDTDKLESMIHRFLWTGPISQENAIILMKAVPERMHTVVPGMMVVDVIARHFGSDSIIYSDSGVREGFIYSEILGK